MTGLVLDASAVVDLLLRNQLGGRVRERLVEVDLHSVAHLDAEVFSALARIHRGGALTAHAVDVRLGLLGSLDISRVSIAPTLLHEAWAFRGHVAARDALYVALARRLDCRLLTTDQKLAKAVPDLAVDLW